MYCSSFGFIENQCFGVKRTCPNILKRGVVLRKKVACYDKGVALVFEHFLFFTEWQEPPQPSCIVGIPVVAVFSI